jgi:alkylhydroperoxidase family enzyme
MSGISRVALCFSKRYREALLFPKRSVAMSHDVATPRIAPLEPPYAPELAAMLNKWMPPNSGLEPLALFRTLAVHPELAARMRPLGAAILAHGQVEPRLREVMIHRTCARCGAEYEWGVHAVAFGAPLGLTDEQLTATVRGGADDPVWSDAERAVIRLADELHDTASPSDATFAELERHFDAAQILELVVTAGWYHAISFVISAARVQPEPWAAEFPGS